MAREKTSELTHQALLARKKWSPLPAVTVLHGDADFLKREIVERFIRELTEEGGGEPAVRRFQPRERPRMKRPPAGGAAAEAEEDSPDGSPPDEEEPGLPLAEVVDDLRTPSFFAPRRLAVVWPANRFLAAYREALEPFLAEGFSGGHLVLCLDSLDTRTRFARALQEKGWAVACRRPFDRPPPWQPDADPWDNDLARWVAARARSLGLAMDPEVAHALCLRVGSELASLAEELEKLRSYLGPERKEIDLQAVEAVAGELREDSIFDLVDAYLAADRPRALDTAGRIFRLGYHASKGAVVTDPTGIWSLFVGALVNRLRSLRRAHALSAAGQGPEVWVNLKLTPRPFLPRFQRELKSVSPGRIARAFAALREMDRGVKTGGGDARACLEDFLLRH